MSDTGSSGENPNDILRQFDRDAALLADFCAQIHRLLDELLAEKGLRVHSVTSRVKTRASLERKLARPGRSYKGIDEVTDLVGVRVITYFETDVDKISDVITTEFSVDPEKSVDRRAAIEVDRFGYMSVHYIARLASNRASLLEYKRFAGRSFEVQVRSILQHAWAEIEHDLGYKNEEGIPRGLRRRFSRLAGLLEIADAEFQRLHDEIGVYSVQVAKDVATTPGMVPIDRESAAAYLATSDLIPRLDQAIVSWTGGALREGDEAAEYGPNAAVALTCIGVQTIGELDRLLRRHERQIQGFAEKWLERGEGTGFAPGIALFYLGYVLAAMTGSVESISRYIKCAAIHGADPQNVLQVFRSLPQ